MAGVYIKGMEMPKACCFCELYEPDLYWCRAMKKDIDVDKYESVSSSCPLIPVSDHGRLVDADQQIARAAKLNLEAAEVISTLLRTAPTIIPADKEGEA